MEATEPLSDLLKNLEESLTKLLNRVRGDPWSLLIFQTLIWSFRRWAIHYLMSSDINTTLHDYVWDNHISLVKDFAPDGLKDFASVWLNPSNVGDRIDLLEELNAYFMFIIDKLDYAIQENDDDAQNNLSTFLDETITDILTNWLKGNEEYMIYPGASDSADSFSTEKIFTIMQLILEKHVRKPVEVEEKEEKEAQEEVQEEKQEEAQEEAQEQLPPAQETVASAMRKRTMRVKRQKALKGTRKAN
jgi:hypothetical protein